MSCTLQWSLSGHQHVCISNSQEAITGASKGNFKWKIFTIYSISVLQTPFKFFNQHEIFWRFCMCPANDTFDKNKKILMSVLGLNSKDRKSTWDKANISNPNVNRGCAPLTTNRISADCVQISLGPSIPYIPLGVYHTEGFNAMIRLLNTMGLFSCKYFILFIQDFLCGRRLRSFSISYRYMNFLTRQKMTKRVVSTNKSPYDITNFLNKISLQTTHGSPKIQLHRIIIWSNMTYDCMQQ